MKKYLLFIVCTFLYSLSNDTVLASSTSTIQFLSPTPIQGSTTTNPEIVATTTNTSHHYIINNINDSLVGWWRGESTTTDESGYGNNGTWNSSPSYVSGKFGQSFDFNGSGKAIEIPSKHYYSALDGSITISLWAKVPINAPSIGEGSSDPAGNDGSYLITKTGDDYEWGIENDMNNKICYSYWSAGNVHDCANFTFNDGLFHHYVIVFNDTENFVKVYIDGNLIISDLATYGFNNTNSKILIGSRSEKSSFYAFTGSIDDIAIFNRSLSQSEVSSLYDSLQYPYDTIFANDVIDFKAYTVDTEGNSTSTDKIFIAKPLTPTASVPSGTYYSSKSVNLFSIGSQSIVYSNSPIPVEEHCSAVSAINYSAPITVSEDKTIYVRACNIIGDTDTTLTYSVTIAPVPKPYFWNFESMPGTVTFNGSWNNDLFDGIIDHAILQYKKSTDADWDNSVVIPVYSGYFEYAYIYNFLPNNYDFRIALVDEQNNQGEYSDIQTEINIPASGPEAVDFFGYGKTNGGFNWNSSDYDNTNTSFANPSGVAVDSNHHRLFVADGGGDNQHNNRIMVFNLNNDNTPIDYIADAVIYSVMINESESYLSQPRNVLYDDTTDRLYIADSNNGRVVVINASTPFTTDNNADDPKTIPTAQNILGAGDFYYPLGMTIDKVNGRLFVAEKDKQKGNKPGMINVFDVRPSLSEDVTMCGITTNGISDGLPSCSLFTNDASNPRDVAYDNVNKVLYSAFAGWGNDNRVIAFDVRKSNSEEKTICGITTTGLPADDNTPLTTSCTLGTESSSATQNTFSTPRGLYFNDSSNQLFVADLGNYRVLRFDDMTNILNGMNASAVYGQSDYTSTFNGTNKNLLRNPNSVTVDSVNRRLYVSDSNNNRIMLFSLGSIATTTPPQDSPTPVPPKSYSYGSISGSFYNVMQSPVVIKGTNEFTRDLKFKDTDLDVIKLQKFLNSKGFIVAKRGPGSKGNEINFFGILTKRALIRFQESNAKDILIPSGLKKGTGIFGKSTRTFVNMLLNK